MDRILTHDMAAAIKDKKPLFLLVEIDHPLEIFRGWTGIGTLVYGGESWTGMGRLGNISALKSVTDMSIQEVRFTLSGVEPENLEMLDHAVRRRLANAWLGAFDDDDDGRVIDEPFQLLECEMDTMEFAAEDDGTVTVSILARSGFFSLERAVNEVWSNEDQERRFPGDTGLSFLASLQNQDIIWSFEEPA